MGLKRRKQRRKNQPKRRKKKSKKDDGIPIKAAQKRKRGQMEEESTLAPIEYGSESSESSPLDNFNDGQSDDEELQAMIAPQSKRRKIADSEDEHQDVVVSPTNPPMLEQDDDANGDDDIDLNENDDSTEP